MNLTDEKQHFIRLHEIMGEDIIAHKNVRANQENNTACKKSDNEA